MIADQIRFFCFIGPSGRVSDRIIFIKIGKEHPASIYVFVFEALGLKGANGISFY